MLRVKKPERASARQRPPSVHGSDESNSSELFDSSEPCTLGGLCRALARSGFFTRNIQISAGTSNSHDSGNGIDYGDYTGLSFYDGIAHPAWSDNSDSTGSNPDGALKQFDIYTAAVPVP